jgi:hypothetical protein
VWHGALEVVHHNHATLLTTARGAADNMRALRARQQRAASRLRRREGQRNSGARAAADTSAESIRWQARAPDNIATALQACAPVHAEPLAGRLGAVAEDVAQMPAATATDAHGMHSQQRTYSATCSHSSSMRRRMSRTVRSDTRARQSRPGSTAAAPSAPPHPAAPERSWAILVMTQQHSPHASALAPQAMNSSQVQQRFPAPPFRTSAAVKLGGGVEEQRAAASARELPWPLLMLQRRRERAACHASAVKRHASTILR